MSMKGNVKTATFVCWFTNVPCTSILFTSVGHLTVRLVSLTTIFVLFWKSPFLLKLTSYPAHSWCCRNFGALLFQCLCQSSLAMATVLQLLTTQFSGGTILNLLLFWLPRLSSTSSWRACTEARSGVWGRVDSRDVRVSSTHHFVHFWSFLGRAFLAFAKLRS